MNPLFTVSNHVPAKDSETTTTFPVGSNAQSSKKRPKCNLAMPGSTSKLYSHQIACILRHRLLIAALITAAGFCLFFVRYLLDSNNWLNFNTLDRLWQGAAAAVMVLIATLLASQIKLSVFQLRIVEYVLFGVAALYFAWLQIILFHEGRLLQWAADSDEAKGNFARIANAGNCLRWFALIVIYGTFVPNTWKRCAIFVGILAAIPLALTSAMCLGCPIMGPYSQQALLDTATLLGIASAIAIFGSYKISELHQEALHAKRLGQYQLKEPIGRGGMGEVFLGEHLMLRRKCAVKLIRSDHKTDATSMARFEREVKAMASLTHWNTVEVFDYGLAEDGTFYYVMEYLPGMSLQELVDRYGPLSPARTVYFLRQICDALQEAHAIGLIHRDIKPSNVIASERGGIQDVAKVVDFGLVQSVGIQAGETRLTMQGVVLGSPPYMSPEQAMGKDHIDNRTDIYSIGGLAYFLLTGRPVFERETPMQILMAHVYEPIPSLSEHRFDIPEDLETIIKKCMNKDPKDRFQNVESLEEALAQCSCANEWTRKHAQEWWQTHVNGVLPMTAIAV